MKVGDLKIVPIPGGVRAFGTDPDLSVDDLADAMFEGFLRSEEKLRESGRSHWDKPKEGDSSLMLPATLEARDASTIALMASAIAHAADIMLMARDEAPNDRRFTARAFACVIRDIDSTTPGFTDAVIETLERYRGKLA